MNLSAESKRKRAAAQRDAGKRRARQARCPRCERENALGQAVVDYGCRARKCRYCGHEVGTTFGETFGYDVTPEPGAVR